VGPRLAFIWFYLLKVGKNALYLVFFKKTGVWFVFTLGLIHTNYKKILFDPLFFLLAIRGQNTGELPLFIF